MTIFTKHIEINNPNAPDSLPIAFGSVETISNTLVPGIYTGTVLVVTNDNNQVDLPIEAYIGHIAHKPHTAIYRTFPAYAASAANQTTFS